MRALLFSFVLLSATAHAETLPYKDGDFGCFTQADADRYMRDFSVDVESFGGLDLCNAQKDTKKLLNDLSLIEHATFAADSRHEMIEGLVPSNNYYNWMKGETLGMQRGNDIPFATAYNSGGYFTMQDGWAALSTLGRVGTVIHEARHTAGFPHYACTHGPYAGSGTSGCDTGVAQKGAHAVEMEYYTRVVLDSQNLNPVYKSMARLMALGRANFVFNDAPIKPREALVGRSGDHLVIVDGANVTERAVPQAPAGAVLKRTSFGASFVKGTQAVAVDLYENVNESFKDDYSYFKLFQTPRPNGPESVNAIEEIDVGTQRYFAVLGENGKVYSYDFPNGAWHRASASMAGAAGFVTRTPAGATGLFVVKSDGTIVPFDFGSLSFQEPVRERWAQDTLAYAQNSSTLVKLLATGQVVDASTGAPVAAFAGKNISDLVNVPLYDAFEVSR